ncbi:putative receptor-like protein kinase At3g47110 [Aristolochia californica]|uniref:putative receptor-like protein kinase At3g47110 n=1 Tax=Aristolochia californica TaxID=171875 RepID=UPI0035DFC9B0
MFARLFQQFLYHLCLLCCTNLFFTRFFIASVALLTNETDHLALLAIRDGMISDPAGALSSSWNQSRHFCKWNGVTCSRKHQRVTALDLSGHGLEGTVSPHIANLTFLRRIDLGNNRLYGGIPQQIGRLFRLRYLNITANSFEGEIPANISYCSELRTVDLSYNNLTGRLPAELGSLFKIIELRLGHNNLGGSVPSSFGNLSSLGVLSLERNNLEGSLPDEFGRMRSLEHFEIYENNISGIIPPSLYNLSSVKHIDVSVNKMIGSLPPDLGILLPDLDWLMLGANGFTGRLPDSITNASKLEFLDLTYNMFLGPVPENLGRLKYLRLLTLSGNYLGQRGQVRDLSFFPSLTNCTSLEILAMEDDNFTDVFPSSVTNLSTTLQQFLIGGNRIYGSVPDGIGNLVNLTVLSMSVNSLKGVIPEKIGRLQKLQGLFMNQNNFSGRIPTSLGNFTQLNKLNLADNSLEGGIPRGIENCRYLQSMNLSRNSINGTMPREIFSLRSLFELDLSHNSLSGSLPVEVGSLENLQRLDISHNRLVDEIPAALGKCVRLEFLYMDDNFFYGSIPSFFRNLSSIRILDLSRNNLSGPIPDYLGRLNLLEDLNLSFNDLEGNVPEEGIFRYATAISVSGNSRLCGGIPVLKLPTCPAREKESKSDILKIVLPIGGAVFCLSLAFCLYAIFRWRRNKKTKASTTNPLDDLWLNISYAELLKATDGFSSTNLIGVGSFSSVYKGSLDQNETTVAVKVLNLQQQGATKSFIAECKALRNIRHRNLLKIVTACSSTDFKGNDFKALVFEYMPHGSLDKWLHPKTDARNEIRCLTLAERLNIAIDVASSLDYLHNQSQTPIVHRDLKPSNVLLDEDMRARVGDFGLAKFLPETTFSSSLNQTSSAGIQGSVGYVAPEYGMGGHSSTRGDVYSYGILLLEMFTRKRPTDDKFTEGLSLHRYADKALPQRVMEIVDPELLLHEGDESRSRVHACLVSVIRIGVSCSEESPAERMDMNDVVTEILAIRDSYLSTGIRRDALHSAQVPSRS